MRIVAVSIAALLLLPPTGTALAAGPAGPAAEPLARLATSADPALSGPAIADLRRMGPAGLEALFTTYAGEIERSRAALAASTPTGPEWDRLSAALDAVGQQRDDYASRLYWYTDLDQAKAAAKATGRPVLSLRLLGRLDEEFSCANSRFFRTALYANSEVSAYLREHFVLHWRSVRPAPHVTIDFGDGRKIERTITGNSIHYVLDAEGRPLDALPGLYGPQAFLRELRKAEGLSALCVRASPEERDRIVSRYHATMLDRATAAWAADLKRVGVRLPSPKSVAKAPSAAKPPSAAEPPSAAAAAPLAVTKSVVEIPLVRAFGADTGALESATDAALWTRIAALHAADAKLDSGSTALVRCHGRRACEASGAGPSGPSFEEALPRIVSRFEQSIALDTVRNEYLLHSKLHGWLAESAGEIDVESLNERVYAELFLTPGDDPWLGLVPTDTYTGLDH